MSDNPAADSTYYLLMENTELKAGIDPASNEPEIDFFMLKNRDGSIRYMVKKDKADKFNSFMQQVQTYYNATRLRDEKPASL